MKIIGLLAAASLALAIPAAANASILFDFDTIATGTYGTVTQTVSGLTASITSASGSIKVEPQSGIPGISGQVLINYFTGSGLFTADFSSAVNDVSITGGDFGADTDHIFLAAYSGLGGTGTFLGSITSAGCCSGSPGSATVSLIASGIKSVQFYTGAGDPFPGSAYFDNLKVGSLSGGGVPEPASWAMMLLGFGGIGALIRNRRRAVALAA